MSAKILDIEGCENKNCEAWLNDCKRAVVWRVGKFMSITMVTPRFNKKRCELFMPRRFKDVREPNTK